MSPAAVVIGAVRVKGSTVLVSKGQTFVAPALVSRCEEVS